jgi:predicted HTH domain antitoxin
LHRERPLRYYGKQDFVFNEKDFLKIIEKSLKKRRFSVRIFPTKQTSSEKVLEEHLPLDLLKQGKISSGKMAELLGLRYDELLEKLITQGIPLNFGPSNLEEAEKEIEVLRKYKK